MSKKEQTNITNRHTRVFFKKRSKANLQRKFDKQSLAENKQNNSVKNSILNAHRSHSTSRNIPTEVPVAKQTKNNINEALQIEIEILKK